MGRFGTRGSMYALVLLFATICTAQTRAVTSSTGNSSTSQLTSRTAKIDGRRAVYFADKKIPGSVSTFVSDPGYPQSAGISTYSLTPQVAPQGAPQRAEYGPYLAEGNIGVGGDASEENKTARIFGLSTTSQDIQLGLQFTVPFLSVPISNLAGRYTDLTSLLQLNWRSLALIGLLVAGSVLIVPWVVSQVTGSSTPNYLNLSSLGRSEDVTSAGATSSLMSRVDDVLGKYNIDSTACMQRAVCNYVQSAATKVQQGSAESTDLLIDGAASNSYLASWLDGTSFLRASEAGRAGMSCSETFSQCPLNAQSVYRALTMYLGV